MPRASSSQRADIVDRHPRLRRLNPEKGRWWHPRRASRRSRPNPRRTSSGRHSARPPPSASDCRATSPTLALGAARPATTRSPCTRVQKTEKCSPGDHEIPLHAGAKDREIGPHEPSATTMSSPRAESQCSWSYRLTWNGVTRWRRHRGRRALAIHTFIRASRLAQSFAVGKRALPSWDGSSGAEGSGGHGGWPNQSELATGAARESRAGSAGRERMHYLPLTRARQVRSTKAQGIGNAQGPQCVTDDRARRVYLEVGLEAKARCNDEVAKSTDLKRPTLNMFETFGTCWHGMVWCPSYPLDRNRCDQVVAAGSGAS
jgi:hypothetical protein